LKLVMLGQRATTERHTGASDGGFTLIELMIVIVVLGILAGITIFGVGAFRSDARNAACRTDVRTLLTANAAYAAQHDGASAHTAQVLVDEGYIGSAPSSGVTFADGVTSPATIDGCTGDELALTPPSDTPTIGATASGSTVHPGDPGTPDFTASVTVTVTDQDHVVVEGAVVAGAWSDGATGTGCTTDASGSCTFGSSHSTPLPNTPVTWTLSSTTKTGYDQASGSVTLACGRHNNAGGTTVCT
jgi:general secretion pathway protein G